MGKRTLQAWTRNVTGLYDSWRNFDSVNTLTINRFKSAYQGEELGASFAFFIPKLNPSLKLGDALSTMLRRITLENKFVRGELINDGSSLSRDPVIHPHERTGQLATVLY